MKKKQIFFEINIEKAAKDMITDIKESCSMFKKYLKVAP
jgi:hypothetical protein